MTIDKETLKYDLKKLIIVECDKEDEFSVADISDDDQLIGADTKIGLDSLDALQLSLAIKQKYGVRIEGVVDGRKAFSSIRSMANYILEKSI